MEAESAVLEMEQGVDDIRIQDTSGALEFWSPEAKPLNRALSCAKGGCAQDKCLGGNAQADTEALSWAENVDRTSFLRCWLSFYSRDSYPGLLSTCHFQCLKNRFYARVVSRNLILLSVGFPP